jgi:5'-methylthioadenosine phosphorylase
MIKIGIIGGSGLDDPKLLEDYEEKEIETEYGMPSSKITIGKVKGVDVCILARHGKGHTTPPSQVNFRANIKALSLLGCTHIIATTAVGSLKEEIKPTDLVFPNQFIDFTKQRKMSFFDKTGSVTHTPMAEPLNKEMREILCMICEEFGFRYHRNKTILTIEGPRFSTKAESNMFRQWGADIINMSSCPEIALANELKIPYQTIAMSTDYDCWKENEESVAWEMIERRMNENSDKVKKLLARFIEKLQNSDEEFIKSKIRTIPDFPKQGIMFRDITTLLKDNDGMKKTMEILQNRYKDKKIDIIAGIESRGFIFGSILADRLNAKFVPIRKRGKLPYQIIKQEYDLEYGKDIIEIHIDAVKRGERVLIIDDLIATGGTALAACQLVEKMGAIIEECAFVVELPELKGREKIGNYKMFSVVRFEGE